MIRSLFIFVLLFGPASARANDYHGTKVYDRYDWLEVDSPERDEWLAGQEDRSNHYFNSITSVEGRVREIVDRESCSVPVMAGERLFYVKDGSLVCDGRVLAAGVSGFVPNDDGSLVAFGVSQSGEQWSVWQVVDVATGEVFDDRLEGLKLTPPAWGDGHIYYVAHEPAGDLTGPLGEPAIYCHVLGGESELLVQLEGNLWVGSVWETESGELGYSVSDGCERNNGIVKGGVELFPVGWAQYKGLGKGFYLTTEGAPMGCIVRDGKVVVPEGRDALEAARLIGDHLVVAAVHDGAARLIVYSVTGAFEREIVLPGMGSVSMPHRGMTLQGAGSTLYFGYTDSVTPPMVMRCDLESGELEPFFVPQTSWKRDDYETRRVFFRSKDGTRVPLFITFRKGLRLDGRTPTLLYAYGGFKINCLPSFHDAVMAWLDQGGIYAHACPRGGGEYGDAWYRAGQKENKQNCFDDFIAAAEYLVHSGYTCPSKLGIYGRSNGGLLVGACMTQRPDLFGAAIPAVGVLDMLKFEDYTVGRLWVSDYGTRDDPDEFATMLKYSPLHNVRRGTRYPATLVLTADHDDCVVPIHSYKFAAALEEAQRADRPIVLYVEHEMGHNAGKSVPQLVEESTRIVDFLCHELSNDSTR